MCDTAEDFSLPSVDVDAILERAIELIEAGHTVRGRDLLVRAREVLPPDARIEHRIGFAEIILGDLNAAYFSSCIAARLAHDPELKIRALKNLAITANDTNRLFSLRFSLRKLYRMAALDDARLLTLQLQSKQLFRCLADLGYRAQIYHNEGRYKKSASALSQIMQLQMTDRSCLLQACNCAALGRADDAFELAKRAYHLSPDAGFKTTVFVELSQIFERHGYRRDAVKAVEQLIQRQECDIEVHRILVRLDETLPRLEDFSARFPCDPWPDFRIGHILHTKGRYEDAISALNSALKKQPDYSEALNELGCTYSAIGHFDKALEVFQKLADIQPHSAQALYNVGWVLNETDQYKDAATVFQAVLVIDPFDVNATNNLGFALGRLGHHSQARMCYERVLELDPEHLDATLNLAENCYTHEDHAAAEPLFEKAYMAAPNDPVPSYFKGVYAARSGQLRKACKLFEWSLSCGVFASRQFLDLLSIYYEANDKTAIVKLVGHGIKHFPDHPILAFNAGAIAHENNDLEAAKNSYLRCLSSDPDYIPALNNLGLTYFEKGQLDEALACFQKATAKDEDYSHGHFNVGLIKFASNQVLEAIEAFQAATETNPDYDLAYLMAGACLILFEQYGEALSILEGVPNGFVFHGTGLSKPVMLALVNQDFTSVIHQLSNLDHQPYGTSRTLGILFRGIAYLKLGEDQKAKSDFDFIHANLASLSQYAEQAVAARSVGLDVHLRSELNRLVEGTSTPSLEAARHAKQLEDPTDWNNP